MDAVNATGIPENQVAQAFPKLGVAVPVLRFVVQSRPHEVARVLAVAVRGPPPQVGLVMGEIPQDAEPEPGTTIRVGLTRQEPEQSVFAKVSNVSNVAICIAYLLLGRP